MRTEDLRFTVGGEQLAGTVFRPDGPGPHPGVVIVHGSGAVDRFGAEGTLRPVIEHFAGTGYTVLSYDKPGVGESAGDWERQTFEDRAAETLAAVRVLAARPDVDGGRVGLWGISQGGWTAPLTAVSAPEEIAFTIVVSASSMSPYGQAMHQITGELRGDGFPPEQVQEFVDLMAHRTAALAAGVPGAAILAAEGPELTARPWYRYGRTTAEELDFIRAIWHFDVRPVLASLRCPLLAVWGAEDVHMPAQRCAAEFAEALAEGGHPDYRLEVHPHATHRLRDARVPAAEDRLAAGYLDGMTGWLAHRAATAPPARPSRTGAGSSAANAAVSSSSR